MMYISPVHSSKFNLCSWIHFLMHELDCNSQSKTLNIDFSFYLNIAHNYSIYQTYTVNRKVTRVRVAVGHVGRNKTSSYVYGV